MTEKRCKTCGSWGVMTEDGCLVMVTGDGCLTGYCTSPCTPNQSGGGMLPTPHHFGCIHWQQREPDLREQLAQYTYDAWRSWTQSRTRPYEELPKWHKDKCRADADRILAIVKGEIDATSS